MEPPLNVTLDYVHGYRSKD